MSLMDQILDDLANTPEAEAFRRGDRQFIEGLTITLNPSRLPPSPQQARPLRPHATHEAPKGYRALLPPPKRKEKT